jgi:hypothetical protein
MTLEVDNRRFRRAATLVVALLLTVGIFFLRLADDNESNADLLLLVVPIALVAEEFGWVGGVTAAAASLGLFAVWNDVNGGGVGPIGYLTRSVVFFGFAAAMGPRHRTGSAPLGAGEHSAKVVGFSPDGTALLRLDHGREFKVPLLEGIRDRCTVGSPALIYFDDKGIPVGWYLPDAGIGVDMQGDRRWRGG